MMKITLRDSATLLDRNLVLKYNNTSQVLLITQGLFVCSERWKVLLKCKLKVFFSCSFLYFDMTKFCICGSTVLVFT